MNKIIAGYWEGVSIQADTNKQLAYVGRCLEVATYITKESASSINIINSTTAVDTSKVFKGYTTFGVIGALAGSQAVTEILVEIVWNNGEKSIAKVSKDIYERMLIGMNTNYTSETIKIVHEDAVQMQQSDEKDRLMIFAAVVLVVGFIILIGVLSNT